MIAYSVNKWGFAWSMFYIRGSVLPKALVWALPCAAISAAVWYYQNEEILPTIPQGVRKEAAKQVIAGFTSVLGFLLIFRTQKAYSRYWECAMYLQKARGEWFNATSNLVAFCTPKPEKDTDVKKFRQQLVRLISLLFCSAIGEVCLTDVPVFEVINPLLDKSSTDFLQSRPERCEIVMVWIQRLVVDNIRSGCIEIAPPIVSRVFQEFSLGIVNIAAAKKITIIPFPFPYSQMMQMMLVLQALVQPVVAGYAFHQWWVAAANTFIIVLLSWCIHFIAMEIEMPFGDDANDLPLGEFIVSLNDSLFNLLEDEAQRIPVMQLDASQLHTKLEKQDRISWNAKRGEPMAGQAAKGLQGAVYNSCNEPEANKGVPSKVEPDMLAQTVSVPVADANTTNLRAPLQPIPEQLATSTASAQPPSAPARALPASQVALGAPVAVGIEGQLLTIKMEGHLDKISAEVTQMGIAGLRLMERMDRMDKATVGRPIPGANESPLLWFCADGKIPELGVARDPSRGPQEVARSVPGPGNEGLMRSAQEDRLYKANDAPAPTMNYLG